MQDGRDSASARWGRSVLRGALAGLACYAVLLGVHLVKFRKIEYAVPNIAGYAGPYPGYGFTWDLTAVNLPTRLLRSWGVRVRPQVIRFHGERRRAPSLWSPWVWVGVGASGYAMAGALLVLGGFAIRRYSRCRSWADGGTTR
jgi:hypothetical protein